MNVISFALWGDLPKYTVGALRNAALAPSVYPSWICRFHCGTSVPEPILRELDAQSHVQVVRMAEPGDWRALFWRFEAASDPDVTVMISRDTDSRLGRRERAAVDAWLASSCDFHVMRDHPLHGVPILGGMWGVRGNLLRDMRALVAATRPVAEYQADQRFLADVIAPRVRDRWLEHDEYFAHRLFPTRREGTLFVGQPFDEHDRPLIERPGWLAERRHALRTRQGPLLRMARWALRRARSR